MKRDFIFLTELFTFLSVTIYWKKLGRKKRIYRKLFTRLFRKNELLKGETLVVRRWERLHILRSILAEPPVFYKLDSDKHR